VRQRRKSRATIYGRDHILDCHKHDLNLDRHLSQTCVQSP
jgi:hypothetical protein